MFRVPCCESYSIRQPHPRSCAAGLSSHQDEEVFESHVALAKNVAFADAPMFRREPMASSNIVDGDKVESGVDVRGHPAVQFFRCREVRAESSVPVRCQADGERAGDLPASFKIHPGGLRCVTS